MTSPTIVANVVLLALAAGVIAQPVVPRTPESPVTPPPPENQEPALTISLTPRAEYTFDADLHDNDGRSNVARAGGAVTFLYPASERLRLGLTLDGEYSWYNFSGNESNGGSGGSLDKLLNGAYAVGLVPSVQYAINERWGILVGAIVQSEAEDGGDFDKSLTYGGFGGVRYAFNENFALTLGGGATSRLEDDAGFFPVIGVEWKVSERIKLATERLGAKIKVKVCDSAWVWLSSGYESREYRLADDHAFAPEGVGRDHRVPIKFGLEWTPSATFSLEGYTGVVVWQEYEFLDRNGNQVLQDNSDPTAVLGVKATFVF